MKSRKVTRIIAMTLFAVLTIPIGMAAQDNPSRDPEPKHQKYRLVDLGTFGGPASLINDITRSLNDEGVVVGLAENPEPLNPYSNPFACYGGPNVNHAFAWVRGATRDLGALFPADQNCSNAVSISNSGQIAGVSENGVVDPLLGMNEVRAIVWEGARLLHLGTFGGNASGAQSINNRGQVTGFALNAVPDPFSYYGFLFLGSTNSTETRGFLWQGGDMEDLGTLGGSDTLPVAISDAGQIAGNSYTNSIPNETTGLPTIDPFFWDKGKMTDIGTLGGVLGFVNDMNNRGQVVGLSDLAGDQIYHAFLWDRRRLKDLGTLGGSTSEARWINEAGEIVGAADFAGDQIHDAVLWKNDRMIDLGNLGRTSFAHANNNNGQVVGASRLADGTIHAFLWEKGGPMADLNDLIPGNSALTLEYAIVVNDRGIIGGTARPPGCNDVDDGCGHAFMLVPDGDCDEDNEARIVASQNRITAEQTDMQYPTTTKQDTDSRLSPAERFRNMMRRYHLPGQPVAPRD